MMVANSFDLWQKDDFFSAAEEVQDSADIMGSVYRMWLKLRRQGLDSEDSNELRREVQIALGTAKWQLEEFERAVRMSHGYHREDNTITRHKQFVDAIEEQISQVEMDLRESLSEEGSQPLRWVNLDEEERDDFAAFLSGSPVTSHSTNDGCVEVESSKSSSPQMRRKDVTRESVDSYGSVALDCTKGYKDVVTINKDSKYVVELEAKEVHVPHDGLNSQAEALSGQPKVWSSPNFGSWKIVIADEEQESKSSEESAELTVKGKGIKNSFWKPKSGERVQTKGGISSYINFKRINRFTLPFGRVGGLQRQWQGPQYTRYNCSVKVMLLMMLTIFLVVPFVFYST